LGRPLLLKNNAKTINAARDQSSINTVSTIEKTLKPPTLARHAVMVGTRRTASPASRRRLMSYRPVARYGPTSRKPHVSPYASA
jgi:hypothetical protein